MLAWMADALEPDDAGDLKLRERLARRQTLETVADGFVDQVELTATWLVRRREGSLVARTLVQPESGITLPTIIPNGPPGGFGRCGRGAPR